MVYIPATNWYPGNFEKRVQTNFLPVDSINRTTYKPAALREVYFFLARFLCYTCDDFVPHKVCAEMWG